MGRKQDCSLIVKKSKKKQVSNSWEKNQNTHAIPYNHCPIVTYSLVIIHLYYNFDTPRGMVP